MDQRQLMKDLSHIAILVILVGMLFFLLTWTGVIKCRIVPGWCNAYWTIVRGGQPRIMIAYGDSGMGDPDLLKETLSNPTYAGVFPIMEHIDRISLGNLKDYDLVIVEKARKIPSGKLRAFMEYVQGGGRLVWTGDAGVEAETSDEYLRANEDPNSDTNSGELVGPWARKEGTKVIAFHEFLGVQYETNYCSIKDCQGLPWQGTLVPNPTRDHPLVYALRTNLVLRGDFAIAKDIPGATTTRVLSLDWKSNLVGKNQTDYGQDFPLIVTSGYGERVAYYAVPPDQFVSPEQPEKYYSLVENVYYGMLR